MKRLVGLGVLLLLGLPCLVAADDLFEFKPVAAGIYAAIARSPFRGQCNSAIILLDEGVLVVDTQSSPEQARAVIAQVRALTDKPVRYVVNTHFHRDHWQGNPAYREAWPHGLEIIALEAMREHLEMRGKTESDVLPTLTFERRLILRQGARRVELLWLGRGHTDADLVVYLPQDKVLMSGDLLHTWTPYMGDSYPWEWIGTLDRLRKLDFETVIPGHGDVLHGKAQCDLWKQYLRDLMGETMEAYKQGATLAAAQKTVAAKLEAKYAGKFPDTFPKDVLRNIEKAYQVASGRVPEKSAPM
jgi:glyoxylase-like metal-dependent hydrolase (beta-lactamase superfamily II)